MPLLLASLLLAAAASAPVVAPENLSPAMGAPPVYAIVGPSSTAVRDGDGFLLAFSAEDAKWPRARTFVTRLDAFGKMTGNPTAIPVTNDGADAVLPSIVAAPDGWYVGQMEQTTSALGTGVVWRVNPNLPLPATPFATLSGQLFLRGDDGKFFASSFSTIFEYTLDGALVATHPSNNADDVVVIGGEPLPVAHYALPYTPCFLPPCGTQPPGPSYLIIVGLYEPSATTEVFHFVSNHGVGAATDGATLLTAFYSGDPRTGGDVKFIRFDDDGKALGDARTLGAFPGDPLQQPLRPAVAYDGVRYLAVWQTGHAIAAAAIDADGNVTSIPLPHLGDDAQPNVVAAGRGKFLISYGAVRNGEWHLATRLVYFDLGRRPVARR
jgi:hypothetical protein